MIAYVAASQVPNTSAMRAIFRAIETAPIEDVAMVLGAKPVELVARLEAAGMEVEATSSSLTEVAYASRCSIREVMAAALNDL